MCHTPRPHPAQPQEEQQAPRWAVQQAAYGIVKVRTHLARSWQEVLPLVQFVIGGDQARPTTTLVLHVADQAELVGIVNRLHGMGLPLISVEFTTAHDRLDAAPAQPDDANITHVDPDNSDRDP